MLGYHPQTHDPAQNRNQADNGETEKEYDGEQVGPEITTHSRTDVGQDRTDTECGTKTAGSSIMGEGHWDNEPDSQAEHTFVFQEFRGGMPSLCS